MKKNIFLIIISIIIGILFTFFILNKENTYAQSEYLVYAIETNSFKNYEEANIYSKNYKSSIIINDNNNFKVVIAIYKDLDILNEMVVYFENQNINVYLSVLKVNKEFYNILNNYERIIKNRSNDAIIDKINQSILNEYQEFN